MSFSHNGNLDNYSRLQTYAFPYSGTSLHHEGIGKGQETVMPGCTPPTLAFSGPGYGTELPTWGLDAV